jgi:excinuclease ABC subunit C
MLPIEMLTQMSALPVKPGVYLFKDHKNNIIYVGKASNLQNRIKSYFTTSTNITSKIQRLINAINDLEYIITDSEQEALILENNLIKKYRPQYNVHLKDDKSFPYFKIDVNNDWPKIRYTRSLSKDGSKYYGPFADAGSARKTYSLIKKLFPFRSCNKEITGKASRPCLNYHINRCLGPCIGAVNKKDYKESIRQVTLFLEGKQEIILRELKQKMERASGKLQFEKAALLRDQIKAIESVIEGQKIAVSVHGDQDVIAFAQTNDLAFVQIFFIRNSKSIGRDSFLVDGIQDEKPEQVIASFIKQYYMVASTIPPKILLQYPVDEPLIISEWLKTLRNAPVKIQVPQKGPKKQLLDMVAENARQALALYQVKQAAIGGSMLALKELKEQLNLPSIPLRIECYDISNIRGNSAVGSMAVFDKGMPKPSHYRRFRIETVTGIDDYSMMQEVIRRRFHKFLSQEGKWAIHPDLVLIDGGKGHLNAVLQTINEMELNSIPVASIAKENEEIYLPGRHEPLNIPKTSATLHLLQRIRDEAHRFALNYHQKIRSKKTTSSILDTISGIGQKRKKALIKKFGSVRGIKEASIEELTTVNGITTTLATVIKECL